MICLVLDMFTSIKGLEFGKAYEKRVYFEVAGCRLRL
jgi:hypothetical protein